MKNVNPQTKEAYHIPRKLHENKSTWMSSSETQYQMQR